MGDILTLADGTTAPVTYTYGEQLDEPVIVYNFEVSDFHTYYVTDTGVLVHNANKLGCGPTDEELKNKTGEVKFKAPPNATPAQIKQVKNYVQGCNEALEAGKLSSTGRVSTKGTLRAEASFAAKAERLRANELGNPYKGHVGHVPDTTWTNSATPFKWEDYDPVVNTSLGGQSLRYPI